MAKLKDWMPFHSRNILREDVGVFSKIEPGYIVRFNYKGEFATTKRPLVLVLNPRYKGKMHAIKLDNISDALLLKLKGIIIDTVTQKSAKLIGLRLSLLKASINDPQRFYESRLKPYIKTFFGHSTERGVNPYRTYLVGNITNLKFIDYKFKDFYDTSTGDAGTVAGKTREL